MKESLVLLAEQGICYVLICVTSEYSMTGERFVKEAANRNHLPENRSSDDSLQLRCGESITKPDKRIKVGLRDNDIVILFFALLVSHLVLERRLK